MGQLKSPAAVFEAEPQGLDDAGDSIPQDATDILSRTGFGSQLRARCQSDDEWLKEYETGVPVMPANRSVWVGDRSSPAIVASDKQVVEQLVQLPAARPEPRLKYIDHRTSKQERLILSFVNVETGQEVVAFFNVSLERRQKGKYYRAGQGGQFNPGGPRSKFQHFWIQAIGEAPRRWSRVHHELHRLKDYTFRATTKTSYRSDGSPFIEAVELHRDCTEIAPALHTDSTEKLHSDFTETRATLMPQPDQSTRQPNHPKTL